MTPRLICLLVGYLCGCVLTADVVARRVAKRSVFELGDGNPGMANVGHELGTPAALCCLAGDILKTFVPALVLARVLAQLDWPVVSAWCGLGATLGHIFPFWHRFRGGKGVTTIASTIIPMCPLWGILAGVVAFATIVVTGYLSIAAVVAMAFYTLVTLFVLPPECAAISCVFTAMQVAAHWSKLRGIRAGTTRRAGLADKFRKR